MKILVTAGPTREIIDPVRFVSNKSSGKMGYAVAESAVEAGFEVILISGPVAITPPDGLAEFIRVETAAEMADAVKNVFPSCDAAIMCAAVADYRPCIKSHSKLKKTDGNIFIEFERTEDILASLGKMKTASQILIGFAAETDNLDDYAISKLERKNLDWICANIVGVEGRGFQADNNAVTLFSRDGRKVEFELDSKKNIAKRIIRTIFDT